MTTATYARILTLDEDVDRAGESQTRGDSRLSQLPVSHTTPTPRSEQRDSGSGSTDAVTVDMGVHRESTAIGLVSRAKSSYTVVNCPCRPPVAARSNTETRGRKRGSTADLRV
jgi:hypothetical protein